MDIESEINELKRRVGDLEGAVNVLTGRLGDLHPEMATLKEQTAQRFDTVEALVTRVEKKVDMTNTQVWSLRDDFPALIEEALKQAQRRRLD